MILVSFSIEAIPIMTEDIVKVMVIDIEVEMVDL
jgi:hypothetical protein